MTTPLTHAELNIRKYNVALVPLAGAVKSKLVTRDAAREIATRIAKSTPSTAIAAKAAEDAVFILQNRRLADAVLEVLDIMVEHGEKLCGHLGADRGIRDFRKHTSWYLTGYPVGGAMRRSFSEISSLDELRRLADSLDRSIEIVPGGERISRGHTNGPIKVQLPENYLADRDDMTIPDDGDVMALSGG